MEPSLLNLVSTSYCSFTHDTPQRYKYKPSTFQEHDQIRFNLIVFIRQREEHTRREGSEHGREPIQQRRWQQEFFYADHQANNGTTAWQPDARSLS